METEEKTGFSRFGRLRKKPSKLMDFQSCNPDNEHNVSNTNKRKKFSQTEHSLLPIEFVELPDTILKLEMFNENLTDEETETSSSVGDNSENIRDDPWYPLNGKQPTNKIVKDGKLGTSKSHRKYKRKKRYTGYSVWAVNIRSEILSAHPEMDFTSVSRKLAQMWANVPQNQKYNYKRRAKRLSSKAKKNSADIIVQTVQ